LSVTRLLAELLEDLLEGMQTRSGGHHSEFGFGFSSSELLSAYSSFTQKPHKV
jgi:hypothetical protein